MGADALGVVLLLSLISPQPAQAATPVIPQTQQIVQDVLEPVEKSTPQVPKVVKEVKKPLAVLPSLSTIKAQETTAAKLAKLPPVMRKIAHCESGSHHYDPVKGGVLRGRVTPGDVGLFQINTKVHLIAAKKLGFDVFTKDGNIAYAMHLYKTQGLSPWSASQSCWA